MKVDQELTQLVAALDDRAHAADLQGREALSGAFLACKLMLIDAAYEDGVELDREQLGFAFGVVDA